jgi:uncharacterized protein YodC (DUF2158 family)
MAQFKTGDVVEIKSGGPDMTIREIRNDGLVSCKWWSSTKQEFGSDVFAPDMLKPVIKQG